MREIGLSAFMQRFARHDWPVAVYAFQNPGGQKTETQAEN